jgi:uncharacterized protein YdeI (YjbR/CyaY-like superfamily)
MNTVKTIDNLEVLAFTDAALRKSWLADHHDRRNEAWLMIAKKGFAHAGITIGDALDVALCFGWIDSHRRARDKVSYLQRYSPRQSKSPWSRLNVDRAEALIGTARMREAGHLEISAAQKDGRWSMAYEPQSNAVLPVEVTEAIQGHRPATEAFALLSKSARYALVLPFLKATDPASRAKRLLKLTETITPRS